MKNFKKIAFFWLSFFVVFVFCMSSNIKVKAFYEIGQGNCVNVTLAEDFYDLKEVRMVSSIITDDGRFSNIHDTVDLLILYGGKYDIQKLKSEGYRTMAVEITIDIREINDGYQYIFIYDDNSTSTYLAGCQIEHHGPGRKDTNWKTYYFYFELDIANINNNDFVIRYGASGSGSDNWKNDNVQMQIGFSEQTRVTGYIWNIIPTSSGQTVSRLPKAQ